VAEKLQRPLYKLEAGDLGSSVSDVEYALKGTLQRCAKWNAVLLIDEADVFLEARTAKDLKRNELVSSKLLFTSSRYVHCTNTLVVFLRLLEYFGGIMILTTNRTSTIDPAFESRIDITLEFPNLTLESRVQIWHNFLNTIKTKVAWMNGSELEALARYPLNGRQIKSAVKTALIMAASEGKELDLDDLTLVLDLRLQTAKLMSSDLQ
jgi:SpoVK/Ycf46/Vps4 family AAA+-type ATPase